MQKIIIIIVLFLITFSCKKENNESLNNNGTLFTKLDASKTGIDFINKVDNEKDFNIFKYRNFYNGGGVAIGEILIMIIFPIFI